MDGRTRKVRTNEARHGAELLAKRASLLAIATAAVIAACKFFAWMHSGSLALLSSFADSLFDITTSAMNFVALKYSHKPADEDHRFGHGKAEAIASFTQGLVLIGISLYIIVSGLLRLHEPKQLADETLGLVVMGISICATGALIIYQRYVLSKTKSLVVKSDSLHYVGDLLTNLAVVASLLASRYYQSNLTDSIIGILIAMFMIYSAFNIIVEAMNHLMDRELSDEEREKILEIAMAHPDIKGVHDLRTRQSGGDIFIQLHAEMDGDIKLRHAHKISDDIEREISKAFPAATVLIHQDVG